MHQLELFPDFSDVPVRARPYPLHGPTEVTVVSPGPNDLRERTDEEWTTYICQLLNYKQSPQLQSAAQANWTPDLAYWQQLANSGPQGLHEAADLLDSVSTQDQEQRLIQYAPTLLSRLHCHLDRLLAYILRIVE